MSIFYIALVAFCLIQRLAELVYSKYNQHRLADFGFSRREAKRDFNMMFLLHAAWFIGLVVEPFFFPRPLATFVTITTASIFVLAQTLRFWTLYSLGVHWNTNIMVPASLESLPSDVPAFITSGPYRYIRHPNYLAVILELLALPLVGGAYFTSITASLLNALVLAKRIPNEELFLLSRPGYAEAMGSKGRFFPTASR